LNQFVADAEDARDTAQEWAENPEDTEVVPGGFSALHWSAKAEGYANNAQAAAGGYGLGVTGSQNTLADLDATDTPTGLYRTTNSTANISNRPIGNSFGYVMVERFDQGNFRQIFCDVLNDDRWHRRYRASAGGFGKWRRFYDSSNIVGTVSNDGDGDPNGAVIERGANPNGKYVRFADGTQMCWQTVTATYESVTALGANWTFPAAFDAAPVVNASRGSTGSATPTNTDVQGAPSMRFFDAGSVKLISNRIDGKTDFQNGDTLELYVKAIGRWS
jgi:hypothetical protein